METQESIPFTLLSSYRIFPNAASSTKVLDLRGKCPILLPDFNEIWDYSTEFPRRFQYEI